MTESLEIKNESKLTEKKYWSSLFEKRPRRSNYRAGQDLRSHARRQIDAFLKMYLPGRFQNILEIGCADSAFLPYFHQRFNLSVAGIDYSEIGCELARERLQAIGIQAPDITCCDLFNAPPLLNARYDSAFSYGLIEHFNNPVEVLRIIGSFLKEDGIIISIVPNIAGLPGFLQKILCKKIWDLHVYYDDMNIKKIHEDAGFKILHSSYLVNFNLGVCNPGATTHTNKIRKTFSAILYNLLKAVTVAWWILERMHLLKIKPNKMLSPYIVCVAQKKSERSLGE